MKFDPITRTLLTDDNRVIKQLQCTRNIRPWDLVQDQRVSREHLCLACGKNVLKVDGLTDAAVLEVMQADPNQCLLVERRLEEVIRSAKVREAALINEANQRARLRIVETARSVDAMNAACDAGLRLLVLAVPDASHIREKMMVIQNRVTGKITLGGDYRMAPNSDEEVLFDGLFYCTAPITFPIAAYLLPPDLALGEHVYLVDLIEHVIGSAWNQGDTYRLKGCEAIWNGKGFDLIVPEVGMMIG